MQRDPDAERHVDAHLDPDEDPVWTGRPDPKRLFSIVDWVMVPFSAFVVAMVVAGFFGILYGAPDSPGVDRGPNTASVVGSIVLLVFLGPLAYFFAVGRFQLKRAIKRRTYYGLTEHRAVIIYDGRWVHRVREALLSESELDIRRRRDGSGTITFRPLHGPRTWGTTADPFYAMASQSGPVAFWDLKDVNAAAAKVRELRSHRRT